MKKSGLWVYVEKKKNMKLYEKKMIGNELFDFLG